MLNGWVGRLSALNSSVSDADFSVSDSDTSAGILNNCFIVPHLMLFLELFRLSYLAGGGNGECGSSECDYFSRQHF